jgi:predicted nucleic acid-binding protein
MMANLINIRKHIPDGRDRYFVDSNVWFWLTYAASNEISTPNAPLRYQTQSYPEYIEKVLDEGARLYHCPLTLSELSSIIERTELDIYRLKKSLPRITKKEFRNIAECRARVVKQISLAWSTISQMSECLNITLNEDLADGAIKVMGETLLDPYDAFYIDSMSIYDIKNIITDDSDFISTDISVFTANNRVN